MPDLEKVIAEIHYCTKGCADPGEDECNPSKCRYAVYQNSYDYDCKELLLKDALALLRRWEPRVMTLKEVETSKGFVWVEFHSINENRLSLEYVNVRVTERFRDSFVLATDSGIEWLRNRGDYNRGIWFGINSGWRCWTSRPTEEQREAVKWDE